VSGISHIRLNSTSTRGSVRTKVIASSTSSPNRIRSGGVTLTSPFSTRASRLSLEYSSFCCWLHFAFPPQQESCAHARTDFSHVHHFHMDTSCDTSSFRCSSTVAGFPGQLRVVDSMPMRFQSFGFMTRSRHDTHRTRRAFDARRQGMTAVNTTRPRPGARAWRVSPFITGSNLLLIAGNGALTARSAFAADSQQNHSPVTHKLVPRLSTPRLDWWKRPQPSSLSHSASRLPRASGEQDYFREETLSAPVCPHSEQAGARVQWACDGLRRPPSPAASARGEVNRIGRLQRAVRRAFWASRVQKLHTSDFLRRCYPCLPGSATL
jgi:hypothetical protein